MAGHGLSQRQACRASGIARSTLRYRAVARDDSGLIEFLEQHVAVNPRHGLGLIYDSARHQGKPWGKTVMWRVYCDLKLNLPRRSKKRLPARIKRPLDRSHEPNQHWSCDFMADALWSGRRFRTFNVIDELNREAVRIEVDTSLPEACVIQALSKLVEVRGAPLSIRLDNEPEFIAPALCDCAVAKGIELRHIQPGQPTHNAYVERFNKTYRTEVLDCYVFDSLAEVRAMTADWLQRYNHHRPHEALGRVPQVEYRIKRFPDLYFWLVQEIKEASDCTSYRRSPPAVIQEWDANLQSQATVAHRGSTVAGDERDRKPEMQPARAETGRPRVRCCRLRL
jgi:putative transposase